MWNCFANLSCRKALLGFFKRPNHFKHWHRYTFRYIGLRSAVHRSFRRCQHSFQIFRPQPSFLRARVPHRYTSTGMYIGQCTWAMVKRARRVGDPLSISSKPVDDQLVALTMTGAVKNCSKHMAQLAWKWSCDAPRWRWVCRHSRRRPCSRNCRHISTQSCWWHFTAIELLARP